MQSSFCVQSCRNVATDAPVWKCDKTMGGKAHVNLLATAFMCPGFRCRTDGGVLPALPILPTRLLVVESPALALV
jgi:hypothetical protein